MKFKKMLGGMEMGTPWGEELADLREEKWERLLEEKSEKAGKTLEDAKKSTKSAEWKVKIAGALRKQTTATNLWIAECLGMGHPNRVRNLIKERL